MTHQKTNPPANDFLGEIVIGLGDGLIVPFALTAGLSRVSDSAMIVTVGMLAITAGSVTMGLGAYLTGKSEADLYKPGLGKPAGSPGDVKEGAKTFFANLGLSEELQATAAEEITKDKIELEQLLAGEQIADQSLAGHAVQSGLTVGLSYAIGGLVPLSPYIFMHDIGNALKISAVLTLLCLPVLGYFKSRITGSNPLWGAVRTTLTGVLAATGAYAVAKFFT